MVDAVYGQRGEVEALVDQRLQTVREGESFFICAFPHARPKQGCRLLLLGRRLTSAPLQ